LKTEISLHFHPTFTFNGLEYENAEDLSIFAKRLTQDGDEHEISIGAFITQWLDESDFVIVNTSGSTGKPKKVKLLKAQMINSAQATGTFFKLGEKNTALLCLSSNYIAGKMMLVRALTMGWNLHVVAPEKDAITQYDNDYDFVAMVPYQVLHSIDALDKVKKLIIGGGPISHELEEKLQNVSTEVFATYGMTETITHVAVRRLNGPARAEEFSGLPNVRFSTDERGCLVVNAPHVATELVVTNDVVELHSATRFSWLGRFDNVVNSGGVKIFPEQVEKKLAPHIDIPFIIASEADDALGELVILILEHDGQNPLTNYSGAFDYLSKFERPKKVYTLSKFPYTETSKIKRADVLRVMKKYK